MSGIDEQEVQDVMDVVQVEEEVAHGDSVIERLRRQRNEIAEHRTVDIDIPGYDGELFARYRLMDGKELRTIAQRVMKTTRDQDERPIMAAVDTLIAACVEMYVRENGEPKPLAEAVGLETPIRFDRDLADSLGFLHELGETPTARQVVMKTFVDNEIAVAGHNAQLSRWMLRNESETDMEFLQGEL